MSKRIVVMVAVAVAAALLPAGLVPALAAGEIPPPLPPQREQFKVQQEWLKARLERVLPVVMRRHGIAMWIVVSREYNEDPAFFSLVSPAAQSARRRTILVFFDRGLDKGVERLSLGGGSQGGLYQAHRDPDQKGRELWGDAQWALLRKLVEERRPASIGIDISQTHAFSDGLSAGEREQLETALGPWTSRLVRAENLPLEYLSLRVPEMLPVYQHMTRIAHALIARAFSNEVITPGKTTDEDVSWWLRDRTREMGMDVWFPPSVDVQRPRKPGAEESRGPVVIERGDHLHCDFGFKAFGLATDTQHVGYVLRPGETDAPAGLKRALESSNHLQDLLMERMRPGRTGNQVLADTLAAAKAADIKGTIYAHPIGDHGHGAGPLIGLYDRQEGVPGRGDVVLLPSTWFSIELQAATGVPEWGGQELSSAQEEDAVIAEDGRISWVLGRQSQYHLVR